VRSVGHHGPTSEAPIDESFDESFVNSSDTGETTPARAVVGGREKMMMTMRAR